MPPRKKIPEPTLTVKPELTISREEAAEKIKGRIKLGFELQNLPINNNEEVENSIKEIEKWNSYNKELLSRIFTTSKLSEEYTFSTIGQTRVSFGPPSLREKLQGNMEQLKRKIQSLESIYERLELIPMAQGVQTIQSKPVGEGTLRNKVFVVHGHDEEAKQSVARLLEKFGLEAIILHEKATEGRTIIEKFEHYSDVDFAIILLTPDDVGAEREKGSELKARPRQNVILELGYFLGILTRKRVCPLYKGPIDLPSDYIGVGYISMDESGAWRYQLGKELKAAGFPVDLNKI
jgi:predicted nucleotide-binding protein